MTPNILVVIMTLDLNTNGVDLREAVEKLISGKLSWAVFGYTGNTHTLKVIEMGDDLDEMADEFVGSKIMYGYCRIIDKNTALPKFVFINWQGAAAPEQSKFTCSQHLQDVQRFCKTIHVTINARSDDDVDLDEIKEKVAKASGSNYSFHNEKPKNVPLPTKVGSVYQKVNPAAELSSTSRENFWSRDQQDETRRREEEKTSSRAAATKAEADRRARDMKETAAREKSDVEKARILAKQRSFEKTCEASKPVERSPVPDFEETEAERRHEKEAIRREREMEIANMTKARRDSYTAPMERVGTNYVKLDPASEIAQARADSSNDDFSTSRVGTNYNKVDPQADILKARERGDNEDASSTTRVGSNYTKVDPKAELIKARNQGGDGDYEPTSRVGTNHSKVDAASEVLAARKLSASAGVAEFSNTRVGSNYNKVDPRAELEAARQRGAGDSNFTAPVGSVYKKVDPAAEIGRARVASDRDDTSRSQNTGASYDRPNAAAEISAAAKLRREQESQEIVEERRQIQSQRNSQIAMERQRDSQIAMERQRDSQIAMERQRDSQIAMERQRDSQIAMERQHSEEARLSAQYTQPETYNEPTPVFEETQDIYSNEEVFNQATQPNSANNIVAIALYDYQASESDELSFDPGERIENIEMVDEGWWVGDNPRGQRGIFPANYVQLVE